MSYVVHVDFYLTLDWTEHHLTD